MNSNDEKRKCWRCKQDKPLNNNFFYKDCKDVNNFQKACIECQKVRNKKYNQENKEYFKQKGKEQYDPTQNAARYQKHKTAYLNRKSKWYSSVRGRLYDLLESARGRAKKKNLPVDIDLDYLLYLFEQQNKKCLLTDMPFDLEKKTDGKRGFNPYGPSIDKIDPLKGYTKDNIRLICIIVNLAINNFGEDVFRNMCQSYINKINL